jgi:hypothetical protein
MSAANISDAAPTAEVQAGCQLLDQTSSSDECRTFGGPERVQMTHCAVSTLLLFHQHHHQITKLSHSINDIGPAPHRAAERGSTAPLCLQLLRTSQACITYAEMLLGITRQTPLLPQTSSEIKRCCCFCFLIADILFVNPVCDNGGLYNVRHLQSTFCTLSVTVAWCLLGSICC